ncbi:MAG: hypothetical protein K6F33_07160 [Bacteroidales bacterium]|nr:hypothetical protein [Bacteroidales bacterium]
MEPNGYAQGTESIDAVRKIQLGHIDEGLALLETSSVSSTIKNLTKAEVAYWREDYKDAMYYDEHSLTDDYDWSDPFAVTHHLRAYVMTAKALGSISRAKEFLDYYIAQQRSRYAPGYIKPFNSIYKNAMRRLDNEPAKDEPVEIAIYNESNAPSKFIFYGEEDAASPQVAEGISKILTMMWNKVPTMLILDLYEKYAHNITLDDNHIMAARTYLKIGDMDHCEKAIVRMVSKWKPQDKFEVMPMKLFVFHDLMSNMTTSFKQCLLALAKGNDTQQPILA